MHPLKAGHNSSYQAAYYHTMSPLGGLLYAMLLSQNPSYFLHVLTTSMPFSLDLLILNLLVFKAINDKPR